MATTTLPDTAERARAATGSSRDTIPAVELRGVRRHFGTGGRRVQAVDNVDLVVQQGEIVALLGPNGAGKTTTLDMLLGLTDPSEGSVQVLGDRPRQATVNGTLSAVLQTGGLLNDMTVRETVRVIASLYGPDALANVHDVLERTNLTHLARRRVAKCSGGEQQRIKFALALVANPDILVLDEPTAGMDVTARRHFWDVMRADADAGRTIIFATHYLEEAEQFARRTVVMHHGRIVADGPTAQLRASLGGRTIHATLPTRAEQLLHTLQAHPAVIDLQQDAARISIRAADSDTIAGLLLAAGASDLEIAAPTLETAFTALTEN